MRNLNRKYRVKIGIVGCGAIGGGIARYILKELKKDCQLTGIYDIEYGRVDRLRRELGLRNIGKTTLESLIKSCDLMVEAVSAPDTKEIIRQALLKKRHVLAMSVGKLLKAKDLFKLAQQHKCDLLIPSGAVAGIDAIKAAALTRIRQITLTTRKPIGGFIGNTYLQEKGIDLRHINKETLLFEGDVDSSVKFFPQNINVAATLALASGVNNMKVRILTSPQYSMNSHEVEVISDSGRIFTRTENVVCPDNPKTSYLAVLSAIQTLRQFCLGMCVGT